MGVNSHKTTHSYAPVPPVPQTEQAEQAPEQAEQAEQAAYLDNCWSVSSNQKAVHTKFLHRERAVRS